MSYYEILEVESSATQEEIRKSFRRLAMVHHPDKGGDQATFQRINEAYETLQSPEKREQYDASQRNPFRGGGHPFAGGNPFGGGYRHPFEPFFGHGGGGDPFDIFNHMQGVFQAMNIGVNRPRQRCANEEVDIHISLQQAFDGCTKHIRRTVDQMCSECMKPCPTCKGQGIRMVNVNAGFTMQLATVECHICHGVGLQHQPPPMRSCPNRCVNGFYEQTHDLTIDIPAHECTRTVRQFPKLGRQPRTFLEIPGDLVVRVKIRCEDPNISYDEHGNLTYAPTLSIRDLICGVDEFKCCEELTFDETICIPPLSVQPGFSIVREQRGLQIDANGTRGKLIIHPKIVYDVTADDVDVQSLRALFREKIEK